MLLIELKNFAGKVQDGAPDWREGAAMPKGIVAPITGSQIDALWEAMIRHDLSNEMRKKPLTPDSFSFSTDTFNRISPSMFDVSVGPVLTSKELADQMRDAMRSWVEMFDCIGGRPVEFDTITHASWQPEVRDSDMPGIEAAAAHADAVAAFNPPPVQPGRVKPAISGLGVTASGDHRLGRFGASAE